jgi:hypothetical protein
MDTLTVLAWAGWIAAALNLFLSAVIINHYKRVLEEKDRVLEQKDKEIDDLEFQRHITLRH